MKPVYRLLTIFLIPLLLVHFWISGIGPAVAYADEKITTFAPVTAELQAIETSQVPKKGISKWWYVLLIAAAGGAAAAAGGGGDSGSSGGSTGTSTVTW